MLLLCSLFHLWLNSWIKTLFSWYIYSKAGVAIFCCLQKSSNSCSEYKYASVVADKLRDVGLNCEVDLKNHNLNYKIREHSLSKVPVLLICGKKEVDSDSVTIRELDNKKQNNMKLKDFIKKYSTLNQASFN